MASEGRRLAALRDGFGRALEGATGACGFEARAALSPAPGFAGCPKRASRAAPPRAGVQGLLRARAGGLPRHHVRRLLPGAAATRSAPRRRRPAETQLSPSPRTVRAATARHDAGALRRSARHDHAARASPRKCARRGCAAAEAGVCARSLISTPSVLRAAWAHGWTSWTRCALRAAWAAWASTRRPRGAARPPHTHSSAPFLSALRASLTRAQAAAAWRARAGGRCPRRALRCQGG